MRSVARQGQKPLRAGRQARLAMPPRVLAGLASAIHVLTGSTSWVPGPRPDKTRCVVLQASDEGARRQGKVLSAGQRARGVVPPRVLAGLAWVRPGQDLATHDLDGLKVGCAICYGIRFAELFPAWTKDLMQAAALLPSAPRPRSLAWRRRLS